MGNKIFHASLIDVLDRVLDKGIVVEAWVRLAPVGIDLLTMAAPVTAASVQTYLFYESEPTRLQIQTVPDPPILLAPGCLHISARFIDILDLILDKGIVIDPLDRISMMATHR